MELQEFMQQYLPDYERRHSAAFLRNTSDEQFNVRCFAQAYENHIREINATIDVLNEEITRRTQALEECRAALSEMGKTVETSENAGQFKGMSR